MGKNTGTMNYSVSDIDRLLILVETALPLGKDEWERLASSYNAAKPRGAAERDFDSLRRKFKVLHSTRKPTGKADMPPQIKKAKELKLAIDDKANVIELDDEIDDDQREIEHDLCFEIDPDVPYFGDADALGEEKAPASSTCTEDPTEGDSTASSCSSLRGGFQDLLTSPMIAKDADGLPGSLTPRPAPRTRRLGSLGFPQPRKAPAKAVARAASPPAQSSYAAGAAAQKRDEIEASKYPKLLNYSNRLGGADLVAFRDSTGAKRAREDDKDVLEASFAKAKRVRAQKTTAELKSKLDDLENAANNKQGSILETILLLREENERKAEARREEETQRRREEMAAQEARRLVEKAEAEDRRRSEKLEMEDRMRRDREEARARTQELVMLIGVLTKKN